MYYELLNQYGLCEGLVGQNDNNENVIVTIDEKGAFIRTLQLNGWIRINAYYKDGTEEELYER